MSEMEQSKELTRNLAMVQINSKSPGLAIVLVLIFGGLGFFYVSIMGGIVAFFLEIILWVIIFITFGIGIVLLPFYHVLLAIAAIIWVKRYNKSLLAKALK